MPLDLAASVRHDTGPLRQKGLGASPVVTESHPEPSVIDMFETACGIPIPAVTAAQMREVDRIAIDETGPNLFQMMENAGRSLALQVLDLLGGKWIRASVIVLAGGGGN